MAVLPSPESATDEPCSAAPAALVPTSFAACCVMVPPLRINTHAAPVFELSPGPPTMAVLPSADRETAWPCETPQPQGGLTAPLPTSLSPSWVYCADAGCVAQSAAKTNSAQMIGPRRGRAPRNSTPFAACPRCRSHGRCEFRVVYTDSAVLIGAPSKNQSTKLQAGSRSQNT